MTDLITPNELAGLRTDVDQIFSYECRILRPQGDGDLNKNTSEFDDIPAPLVIYNGPYFLAPIISRRDRFDEFGHGLIFTRQYRVDLPHTVDDVQIRDTFLPITADDSQLEGREMLVRDVIVSTHLGYRRLTVQDTRE